MQREGSEKWVFIKFRNLVAVWQVEERLTFRFLEVEKMVEVGGKLWLTIS